MDGTFLLVDESGNATEISGEIKIGRGKASDLIVEDALVSRHHATVWMEGDTLMLRDEGSVNGTFVNHKQIYDPTELKEQDVIQIGDALLTVRAPLAASKTIKKAKKVVKDAVEDKAKEGAKEEAEKIIEELEETVGEMEAADPVGQKSGADMPAEKVVEAQENGGGLDPKKLLLAGAALVVVACCCIVVLIAAWFLLSDRSGFDLIESGYQFRPLLQIGFEQFARPVLAA